MSSVVAAIHFLSAFGVVAAVFGEWLLLTSQPTHTDARRLQRCDALYGLSAMVVVVAGLLRVYRFEKGSDFYLSNPVFLLKIGAFAVAGLLSIYPTIRFIKWRPATRAGVAPVIAEREYRLLTLCIRAELFLLLVMIVCASLMAKGLGL